MKQQLTPLQVFEKGERHLLKQGVKSCDGENYSRYRCEDGRACAVGAFIHHSKNTNYIEGMRANDPEVLDMLDIETPPKVMAVLKALQEIHDLAPPKDWRSRLYGIACRFKFVKPTTKKKGKVKKS